MCYKDVNRGIGVGILACYVVYLVMSEWTICVTYLHTIAQHHLRLPHPSLQHLTHRRVDNGEVRLGETYFRVGKGASPNHLARFRSLFLGLL